MSKKFLLVMAVLLLIGHGMLLLAGSLERSADGWIHLFFSDHWRLRWWEHWEPRWNTGFSLFSYPPLVHQLTALLISIIGHVSAGVTMMLFALIVLATGMYRYARLWINSELALLGVILALSSSALGIAVHTFGQTPSLFGLGLAFHALTYWHRYLSGESHLATALLWSLCAGLSSLYTALFGLFFLGLPLIGLYKQPLFWKRLAILVGAGIVSGLLLLSPTLYFRLYLMADSVPVYHSSQANVLAFRAFNWYMFYGQYASLFLFLPLIFYGGRAPFQKYLLPSLILLIFLGSGGATPLPAWLLGPVYHSLTLDRFSQWAALLLYLCFAPCLWPLKKTWLKGVLYLVLILHLGAGVFSSVTAWRKPLPNMLNLNPVVTFLDQHPDTRYLTLGLHRANQAKLSTLTQANNIDGNYPFGRNQPLLNSSGLASLDMARRHQKGMQTLSQVLQDAEENHLKYIILRDSRYAAFLRMHLWYPIKNYGRLEIWSRKGISALPSPVDAGAPVVPVWLIWVWGLAPLLLLALAITASWRTAVDQRKTGAAQN